MRCSLYVGVHADGQYQSNTFQEALFDHQGKTERSDNFFLTPWDVSHWLDLAMSDLREDSSSAASLIKRLIKRANRFHSMFSRGRGHLEYTGLSDAKGLKALETVTFSTTRFFSSSFDQWKKIYNSYKALIETYRTCREDEEDEEDETKYQVTNVTRRKTCCSLLGPLP